MGDGCALLASGMRVCMYVCAGAPARARDMVGPQSALFTWYLLQVQLCASAFLARACTRLKYRTLIPRSLRRARGHIQVPKNQI